MQQDDYMNEYFRDLLNDDFEDNKKSSRKIFEDMKKEDKGYYSWKRSVEGSAKPVNIEAYGSGDTGSRIRDAVTGERYRNFLVGSKHEDLFFKIRMCTGEFGARDNPTFYYSSPEQYEKHAKTIVSTEIKDKWIAKQIVANNILQKDLEKEENRDRNSSIIH
jgi:hypothetical protein